MIEFQRAVVVGASSGIGAALARQLGQRKSRVALIARREDQLQGVAGEIQRAGGEAHVFVHDVEDFDGTPALFDRILTQLGGLDFLAYAAGVMPAVQENEYDFAKDRQMIEVNLLGAMAFGNLAAAHFEAQRSGTLLGISSVAGERGRRGNPGYGASKAGLTSYFESLRNRLSRYGVSVVTVKPGFVDTPMTHGKPGLFWLISADEAARQSLALAASGRSRCGFVPRRWGVVAAVVRAIPSPLFRKLNF